VNVFRGEGGGRWDVTIGIAVVSLVAYLIKIPSPLVLLAAGLAGVLLLR
jgi:chromate transport protein ChrA